MNDVYDDIENGRTRGGGVSAVAEEVRRVRDRRGEVDRRRDDVRGERQPDGGRYVEHPVGPAVVVVAEGPGQRHGVGPRAYDGHAREDADEVLPSAAAAPTDVADGFLRSIAYSGTAPREADEASEASAATFASRATSAYTAVPTAHGQSRMQERDVSLRELQAAKKHGTATPAGDGCWKYTHNGVVYVTDATQKRVITTYRAEPSPAPRELGDFARLSL